MKTILIGAVLLAVGCSSDFPSGTEACEGDHCVCGTGDSCAHACEPGGNPCHIQCAVGEDCDVTCEPTEECHVEASTSGRVRIDCAGTPECHVSCPANDCVVENCAGSDCVVTCGFGTPATRSGSTASCP